MYRTWPTQTCLCEEVQAILARLKEDKETDLCRATCLRFHTRPTDNAAPHPQRCPARGAHTSLAHPDNHVDPLGLPHPRTNMQLPSNPHHLPPTHHQALMCQARKLRASRHFWNNLSGTRHHPLHPPPHRLPQIQGSHANDADQLETSVIRITRWACRSTTSEPHPPRGGEGETSRRT